MKPRNRLERGLTAICPNSSAAIALSSLTAYELAAEMVDRPTMDCRHRFCDHHDLGRFCSYTNAARRDP